MNRHIAVQNRIIMGVCVFVFPAENQFLHVKITEINIQPNFPKLILPLSLNQLLRVSYVTHTIFEWHLQWEVSIHYFKMAETTNNRKFMSKHVL